MRWSSPRISITWCCSPATAISVRWSRPCSAAVCASPSSSTVTTQPPMVADELRRQADIFTDIVELQSKIGRDPSERAPPANHGVAPWRAPAHAAIPAAQHARTRRSRRAETDDDFKRIDPVRAAIRTIRGHGEKNPQKVGRNCPLCPRLGAFRQTWREREPGWFNAPVSSFGSPEARLLIVGLAPGLRGANRTGRPFTGDYAGDLLYATLKEYGFARGGIRSAARRTRWSWLTRAFTNTCAACHLRTSRRQPRLTPAGEVSDAEHRRDAEPAAHRGARPHRPSNEGEGSRRQALGRGVQPWRPRDAGRIRVVQQAITVRATTPTPAC